MKNETKTILTISALATWESGLGLQWFVFYVLFIKGITLILDLIMPKIVPLIEENSHNQ